MHAGTTIKVVEFGKEVEDLQLPKDEYSEIAEPGQNIGRIYGAFAKGEKHPDAAIGLKRHQLMAQMWKGSEGKRAFGEGINEA